MATHSSTLAWEIPLCVRQCSDWFTSINSIITVILWGRSYYYLYSTDEEIVAQRGKVNVKGHTACELIELGFKTSLLDFRSHELRNYAILPDRRLRVGRVALVAEISSAGFKFCSHITTHLHVPLILCLSWLVSALSPDLSTAISGIIYLHARAQLCPALCDTVDCSPPGSSVPGTFPARILEWLPFLLQENFPTQRSNPCLLCLLHCRRILYHCTTRETHNLFRWLHNKFLLEFSIEKKNHSWLHDNIYTYIIYCVDFELCCYRRLFRASWTAKRSNQSVLKGIRPEYSLARLMLKLEAPILWPPDAKSLLIGKDANAGKDWSQKEKRVAEDDVVG